MSEARIGRVRMKAGGADLRVIHKRDVGNIGERLLTVARDAVEQDAKVMAFSVVALLDTGHIFSNAMTGFTDETLMNRHTFVGMVAEVVRDDLLVWETARGIVNRANGFAE